MAARLVSQASRKTSSRSLPVCAEVCQSLLLRAFPSLRRSPSYAVPLPTSSSIWHCFNWEPSGVKSPGRPVKAPLYLRDPIQRNLLPWLIHISCISSYPHLYKNGPHDGGNSSVSSAIDVSERRNRANESSWIDSYLPKHLRPYARLARIDKQIGTWLLAWPCMWSINLAASPGDFPDFRLMMLFGCGSFLLRGAGCTINDLLDRDIDTKVQRTKCRPVACGALTPLQGLCFLGFQLLLGLGILLQLNNYSRILGASSLLLVFSYPIMKRLTFWPQAFLGLTFNWGALLGWSAVKGNLDPLMAVLPLYMSGACWTLVYDTIYAHQDKEDDLKAGVKSTALRFGDSTKEWVTGFSVVCVGGLILSGYNADIGWPYYVFLTAGSGHLAWQIFTVDLSCRDDCNRKFVSNRWFGALIYGGIFFGRLLQ